MQYVWITENGEFVTMIKSTTHTGTHVNWGTTKDINRATLFPLMTSRAGRTESIEEAQRKLGVSIKSLPAKEEVTRIVTLEINSEATASE